MYIARTWGINIKMPLSGLLLRIRVDAAAEGVEKIQHTATPLKEDVAFFQKPLGTDMDHLITSWAVSVKIFFSCYAV